jgi:hypothetical protein
MKKVKASSTGTPAAEFLVFLDREDEAEGAREEDDGAHADTHAAHHAGGDADPRPEHRGHQRQGQQPIGVAQHAVALLQRDARPGLCRRFAGFRSWDLQL